MTSSAALLLTGTVGTGKTALAVEAARLLGQRGERAAAIDLDWLTWVQIPGFHAYEELAGRQLAAIWPNLQELGVGRLVLARCVLKTSGLTAIRAALPGVELKVVRLEASAATIEERLRRRDTGPELAEHLSEFPQMARVAAEVPADAVVSNELRELTAVAEEILQIVGWA